MLGQMLKSWNSSLSVFYVTKAYDRRASDDYGTSGIFSVLNNEEETIDDTYSPVDVINELRYRRWYISRDEQVRLSLCCKLMLNTYFLHDLLQSHHPR